MRSIFSVFFVLAQFCSGAFSQGIHWLEYCKDIKKSRECDAILKDACNRAPTDCIEMLREIPVGARENLCGIYCVFKNGAANALLTRRQICSFCFEKDIDKHCMEKHLLEELCWSNNINDQCAEHMHDCKTGYKEYCKNLDSGLFFCKQLNSVDGYASAFQLHCTKALEGKRCRTTLESIRMKDFREVYPICTALCAQAHRLCGVCINTFTRDMTKVGFANELLKKYCERPLVNVTLCSNVIHGDDKPNKLTTTTSTTAKANRTTKRRPPIPTLPRATVTNTLTTTTATTSPEPDNGLKLTILYIVAVVLLILLLGVFALVCVKLTKKQQKMKRGRAHTASTTRSKGTTSKTKTTTTSTSSGDGPSSVVRQLATHSTVVQCANDNMMTEKAAEKSKSKSKKKKGKGKGKRSGNALNRLRQLDTAGVKENDA